MMKLKKRCTAFVTAMVVGSALISTAFAINAVVSEIKYYYVGTQQYANAAKTEAPSNQTVFAMTRIGVEKPYQFVDKGKIGASAELYDDNGKVVATAPRTFNSGKSNYCNSLTASVNPQHSQNYYASGFTYVWDGQDYHTEATYKSPVLPFTTTYAVNDSGQTYGSAMMANSLDERPDLMAAVGNNGVEGYIYTSALQEDLPKTPDEALEQQALYETLSANWDGKEAIVVRTIPLYDSDGQTVIGEYDISFTPGTNNW